MAAVTKRILCLALVALLCASCDMQKLMKQLTAPQDLALADQCFTLLRQHDFAGLKLKLAPALIKDGVDAQLETMAAQIPAETPRGDSITAVNTSTDNGHRTVSLTMIYQFTRDWVQLTIRSHGDSADAMKVDFMDVRRIAPPAAAGSSGYTTLVVLVGIALWLVLMLVIYRRYVRKSG
jgi:hypothetical protein